MIVMILVVCTDHAQSFVVIIAIMKESLLVIHAEVFRGLLQVCLLQQSQHPVLLILRIREMSITCNLGSMNYISRHCWHKRVLQLRHSNSASIIASTLREILKQVWHLFSPLNSGVLVAGGLIFLFRARLCSWVSCFSLTAWYCLQR